MFLPNLDSALKNIFSTLKNGGRIATAVWSSQSKTPFIGFPMSIIMRELNISYSTVSPYPDNRVPGPCSLADERILKDYLQKAGFKDIQVERQNVTFEFDSVNDYVTHVKDISAPLNAILENESANRQEEIWKMVAKEVQNNYTNTADGSVQMNNECICFVGTK
jgi:enediyne biosynthesis protein CalE5